MAGRRRLPLGYVVAAATAAALAVPTVAGGAMSPTPLAPVPLASLGGASVQTLIDLGGDGVTAGGERYFDFSYAATPGAPAASGVRVQAVAAADGVSDGLRFVAGWVAYGGAVVDSTITYAVAPVDPSRSIGRIDLLTNGTAPLPMPGTFVTSTMIATTPTGSAAASILSTFDDGRAVPFDFTDPDVNEASTALAVQPQGRLLVTDTVTVASSTGNADNGLATASVVQNLFAAAGPLPLVPEGTAASAVGLATAAGLARNRRRRTVGAK